MDLSRIYKGMAEVAAQGVEEEEGDYISPEDGLLYCGKCHTRKQIRVNLVGREYVHRISCKCRVEAQKKIQEEEKRRERMARIKELRKAGFPDKDMQKMCFGADDGENAYLMGIARKYVDNFPKMLREGRGLLFFGKVDGGKTFAAASIVNALIDKGYPCMMTNFNRLINKVSESFEGRQEYIDRLNSFDLLAIDDLGTEGNSSFVNGIVYNIINNRYNAGLPTIVTSNLTSQELKNPPNIERERIYSRLYEMMIPVECRQINRRKKALIDAHGELKDLLGIGGGNHSEQ